MVIDFVKFRLLKGLEAEAEKTVRFIEFLEITYNENDTAFFDMRIDRAVIRFYALQRRIETIKERIK